LRAQKPLDSYTPHMTNTALILLCLLVIFSYLFDLFAKRTKIPSVLMLMLSGIGLRYAADYFNFHTFDFFQILPALGTVGLILIVFEGALELVYDKSKNKLIRKAFLAALIILFASAFGIAYIIHFFSKQPFYLCFINAIPFSIISSAVAIPSAANIQKEKREFVVYESSFSDILGIILFNFALLNSDLTASSLKKLGLEISLVLVISVVSCLLLLYLLGKIAHHIKFFLILAILVLIYAIGKHFHLSSLINVLAFGLFLSNAEQINFRWFRTRFIYPNFKADFQQMFQISAESAFLIRTFFFVIFGFVMDTHMLENSDVIESGMILLLSIYVIRMALIAPILKTDLLPEVFMSPRGLISILLFLSIPGNLRIAEVSEGLLFIVIFGTSMIMTVGLLFTQKTKQEAES